jgi:hypothetical protein
MDETFTLQLARHRMSELGLRRVKGHPLRSVIFQRDPEFGSFGFAAERPHQVHE